MADGIALEGIRLVHRYLQWACDDGSDVDARSGMMAASLMGATAFQKGLGGMHAMAHRSAPWSAPITGSPTPWSCPMSCRRTGRCWPLAVQTSHAPSIFPGTTSMP